MRRRWIKHRKRNYEHADWVVRWLKQNGPATIPEIIDAIREHGREVEPHVIRRALLKSRFVTMLEQRADDRTGRCLWNFDSTAFERI